MSLHPWSANPLRMTSAPSLRYRNPLIFIDATAQNILTEQHNVADGSGAALATSPM